MGFSRQEYWSGMPSLPSPDPADGCWQFHLWFLYLFENQLEHQEVHGSRIAEAWLGEF